MATIDEEKVREIVAQVVANLTREAASTDEVRTVASEPVSEPASGHGVFDTPEAAIQAAVVARQELAGVDLDVRKQMIAAMRECAKRHAKELAEAAVAETGIGRVEHKIMKNEGAADLSPGVEDIEAEAITSDDGLLLIERAPIGTINAITPTTNPTSTIINNAIIMVAAGNSVVFAPHPRAAQCCLRTMSYLNDAIVEAGGPQNVLTAVASPSLRHAKFIMEHEEINAICATGGGGVVRAALAAGKKAFAAGPGNPPVVVDETADIPHAAQAIIEGASFDNDVLCIGEKSCFVMDSVADRLIREMTSCGAHLLRPHEVPLLMKAVLKDGHPNGDLIGKDAGVILEAAGIRGARDAKIVTFEAKADHEMVVEEFLMPILPVVRVRSFEDAVQGAVVAESGNHHTAMLHTNRVDRVRTYAQALQVGILVVNGPSFACGGIGGPGFLAMTVAGRTGEGFATPRHFTTERRMSLVGAISILSR